MHPRTDTEALYRLYDQLRDHGTRRGWESASRPGRLPPGKTRYAFYRRLGGPQGRSGQVRKISPPPRFDPRTVQPVASRYTNWATRPTFVFFFLLCPKNIWNWPGKCRFSFVADRVLDGIPNKEIYQSAETRTIPNHSIAWWKIH